MSKFIESVKLGEGLVEKVPGQDLDIANKKYVDDQFPVTHASTTGQTTDDHHSESHTVASHSDTSATGAELDTLTDNSIANTLHRHSELVASDGSPDPAVSVNASGNVGIGTGEPLIPLQISNYGGFDGNANQFMIRNNVYWDSADMRRVKSGYSTQMDLRNSDGTIRFFVAGTDVANSAISFTEAMRIQNDGDIEIMNGNVGIGTTSPSEKLDVDGNIVATGYISGKKSGVFASLDSSSNTTVTTAGTYYPIAGSFTNAPAEDFGVATTYTPGIKYTGTKTQFFEIDWHASGYGDANGQTIHMGIKKNGVLCAPSVMGTFLKFLNEEQALSGTCVIELATNDEIQLVLTSDSNGDVITMEHFTTTISEFFD